MKLKPEEVLDLERILAPLKNDARVDRMKNFIQHGKISTYEHAESVTLLSYWLNKRLRLGGNEKVIIVGAFLHDYYLYDWHETDDGNGLHGFSHSRTAMRNAIRDFGIGEHTQQVIETHMWPLTFTKLPKSREAWIVCLADKFISTKETLLCR